MLTTKLINPEIISALSMCGHGSRILIADGNYPLAEKTCDCKKVYLGLTPGQPTVTDVLKAVHSVCVFEKAEVMLTDNGKEPEIFPEFREELGDVELTKIDHLKFYDECMADGALMLAISTGEKRTYANILLTVGCA